MTKIRPTKEQEAADHQRFLANNARLRAIINPLRQSTYACDVDWRRMQGALEAYAKDYGMVELNPDFQRGHVWTAAQQIHYIENALRGIVSAPAFVIQLNCPNWESDKYSGDLPHGFQCIDGLQRLTAVQKLMDGTIKPFGLSMEDLEYSSFSLKGVTYRFRIEIFSFQSRAELLQHYIDLNAGGTPHSQEEIARVKQLLEGHQ